MLDMILGLAGAAVGLLLFAAGRYTARTEIFLQKTAKG